MSTPVIQPSPNTPWDSENCAVLKTFLNTVTGQRAFSRLAELTPELLEDGSDSALLIRSGKVKGHLECLKNLLELVVPEPEPRRSEENYPPLEDDTAHNDGKKASEPTE